MNIRQIRNTIFTFAKLSKCSHSYRISYGSDFFLCHIHCVNMLHKIKSKTIYLVLRRGLLGLDCEQSPFSLHWSCSECGSVVHVENRMRSKTGKRKRRDCRQLTRLLILTPCYQVVIVGLSPHSPRALCFHTHYTINGGKRETGQSLYVGCL